MDIVIGEVDGCCELDEHIRGSRTYRVLHSGFPVQEFFDLSFIGSRLDIESVCLVCDDDDIMTRKILTGKLIFSRFFDPIIKKGSREKHDIDIICSRLIKSRDLSRSHLSTIETDSLRMKEVLFKFVIGKVFASLCEDLYLMHEKYKFAISLLIEIEHTACHHECFSCPCRHIEEEVFTCRNSLFFIEVDEVFYCFFLIRSEFLRWVDIVYDILWERIFAKLLVFGIILDPRKEKL
jgi:hypothetical protein